MICNVPGCSEEANHWMEWDEWLCGEHATQAVIEAEEYEDWRRTSDGSKICSP